MARDSSNGQPSAYANEKLREMQSRWNGGLGQAVRQYIGAVWPGLPAPQGVATSANSTSQTEYITDAGFPELGYYQIPQNTYNTYARAQSTVAALGRAAGDWRTDVPGQVATGLRSRYDDAAQLMIDIPAIAAPMDSQWAWVIGEMAYIMGSGTAERLLQTHAAQLSQYAPEDRFAALIALATNGISRNDARMLVRAWQRLKTGEVLAAATGQGTGWYQVPLQNAQAYEQALASAYYDGARVSVDGGVANVSPSWVPWVVGGVVTVGVLAACTYVVYREKPEWFTWAPLGLGEKADLRAQRASRRRIT